MLLKCGEEGEGVGGVLDLMEPGVVVRGKGNMCKVGSYLGRDVGGAGLEGLHCEILSYGGID